MVVEESERLTSETISQFVTHHARKWQAAQNDVEGYLPFVSQLITQFEINHNVRLSASEYDSLLTLFYMAIHTFVVTLPNLDTQIVSHAHLAFFLVTFTHTLEDIKLMLNLVAPDQTHRATQAIDVTSLDNWVELVSFMPINTFDRVLA
jgi:hypothetical protein